MNLNDEQVDSFRRNGFLQIDRMIEPAAVELLRNDYQKLLSRDVEAEGDRMLGGLIRQIMVPSRELDTFRDNPALEAGREIAKRLLDCTGVDFFFDMLISKEPGQLNETPWHNDYSYSGVPVAPPGRLSGNRSLQFWVALDDVDEENGCMQFIPGSHARPSPEHFVASGADDDPGRLLATEDVDPSESVACPLPAGGCTIHSTGTLHYTGGNHSRDRQRRAYIFNLRRAPGC